MDWSSWSEYKDNDKSRLSTSVSLSSRQPRRPSSTMDEELVIDSPEQEPVEDEELEDPDVLKLPKSASDSLKDRDANRDKFLSYPESLPYESESLEEMDDRLEHICQRIAQAAIAKDYEVGFMYWTRILDCWVSLKYPMKRTIRAKLAKLYYEFAVLPGNEPRLVASASATLFSLLGNRKRLDINDLQLPWEPLYKVLKHELFPKKRKAASSNISSTLLTLCEYCQRFFPPHEIPKMLDTFLPLLDGTNLSSILVTQSFMAHFLPLSHPQEWLQPSFVLWEAFSNSKMYTDQWLDVMSHLAELHVSPEQSNPAKVEKIRKLYEASQAAIASGEQGYVNGKTAEQNGKLGDEEGEMTVETNSVPDAHPAAGKGKWKGIRRDVGIFTFEQWNFLMQRTLRAMGIPVGNVNKSGNTYISAGGEAAAANADEAANAIAHKMKKPSEKLHSLSILLIYSMSNDSPVLSKTPAGSAQPSRTPSSTNVPTLTSLAADGIAAGKPCVGGSRALDSLVKFVNATETFFHPSNHGKWTLALARFLQNVSWEFTKRWTEEERPDCKTPQEWRLTPKIKREFVLAMRQVAFLAMFAKDSLSMGCAQSALKSLSFLEPGLVVPAVLERAFPALQGLLETRRTMACLGAVAAIAQPMISRSNFPAGSKNLLPLLDLCVPGLDVNDPVKTFQTVGVILQCLITVKVDNLMTEEAEDNIDQGAAMTLDGVSEAPPPPEIQIDEADDQERGPQLSKAEEDQLTRETTADFPDWIARFIRAILQLLDNLPEPGRAGKTGGKLEEGMVGTVAMATDTLLRQCSPAMYDVALEIFTQHVIGSPRANSAKAIGQLAGAFGRGNPAKALARLVPVCVEHIRKELDNGASSTRTTTSSTLIESDTAFHWYCLILLGTVHQAGNECLKYQDEILSVMKLLRDKAFSEMGYSFSAKLLQYVLLTMLAVYPDSARSANPDEWDSDEYTKRSHLHWGELYQPTDVKIEWHVPSDAEVNFGLQIVREVVYPALDRLEQMTEASSVIDKEWRNDFNRFTGLIRTTMIATGNLMGVFDPDEPGEDLTDVVGVEHMPFVREIGPARCVFGAALTDPQDPRVQELLQFKKRAQMMLHGAFVRLTQPGERAEDAVDAIRMAISASKHIMLAHPISKEGYDSARASFIMSRDALKFTHNQKKYPRVVWVRRAALYHASRMRMMAMCRQRSKYDDLLIKDMAELAMSRYVSVRKASQKALDGLALAYDGVRSLTVKTFFDALQPGSDPDRIKGALYVLGGKIFGNWSIWNWSVGPTYIMKLLSCQHEQKPSVQRLVSHVTNDFISRLAEPSAIKPALTGPSFIAAARHLETASTRPRDANLEEKLYSASQERILTMNTGYEKLIPELLAVAQNPASHWRYVEEATRFLRHLVRRDQPLRQDMCIFLTSQLTSELLSQRDQAVAAIIKILHFVKLRTFCHSDTELLLQKGRNPLKREVKIPADISSDYTEAFLQQFTGEITKDTILVDEQTNGWLAWGSSYWGYVIPEDEIKPQWDPLSASALNAMHATIMTAEFWDKIMKDYSQEERREVIDLENVLLIKSICQIFGEDVLQFIKPHLAVEKVDPDRHKQRALAEFVAGLMRGSKHWPISQQRTLAEELSAFWPKMFEGIRQDTQSTWESTLEYVLCDRDPRRNHHLISYLHSLRLDNESAEAVKEARKAYLIGCAIRSLSWFYSPWKGLTEQMFWDSITSPYTEVRLAVMDNLRCLNEMPLHPSFTSPRAFLDACERSDGMQLLTHVHEDYIRRIDDVVGKLVKWRSTRQPFAKDTTQPYDAASQTILLWIWTNMNEWRVTTAYPFVERLLPELMYMKDMQDNPELQTWSSTVLAGMAGMPYPEHLVAPVLDSLLNLFKSTSWRTRLATLPLLQVFFFHQLYSLTDSQVRTVVEILCDLLKDSHIEVREAAATTLSGVVRCSQRDSVLEFKDRFLKEIRKTPPPGKRDLNAADQEAFQKNLINAHSSVLGASALILAWPYEVPSWLPSLLVATITKFSTARAPVSSTVKDLLAQFRKTHQDTWAEDQKKFTPDQLQDLHDLVIGTSYYA